MLKGTMKIELTDVHSGETKTVLEQNMVTNALTEIFKPLGLAKSPGKLLSSFAPYYQNLLGGLLLFDGAIEENADNFFPPSNRKLIGCASYGVQNNTTGTQRGGYNQTESELNLKDRYMKYVYDFTTSQANGTIASVCLTHKNGGYTSYGSEDAVYTSSFPLLQQVCDATLQYVYTSYTGATTADKYNGVGVNTNQYIFAIDRVNDAVLYFRIDSTSKISIIKRRAYLKSVSVLENPYSQKAFIEEFSIDLPTALLGNYSYNFDISENVLYICSSSASTTAAGSSFLLTKINVLNWSVTQYSMTNTSNVTLTTSGSRYAFAHNGYVYLKCSASPYDIYKFQIGNAANVVKLNNKGTSPISGLPQMAINGRIYYEYHSSSSSNYLMWIANESTNEILKPENIRLYNSSYLPCVTPVIDEPLLYYLSIGSSQTTVDYMMMTNYLATINNLSDPVTKTADKTMKITYIIQEQ